MKTYAPVTEAVLDALKTIVGAEYVLTEPEKLEQYQTDEETDPRKFHLPEAVVLPKDAQEIAAEWPKRPTNQNRLDFAWAYCAAKRAGKLNELGVEGMGAEEAIDAIADTYDVEIKDNKPEADAPLADAPSE